jgi:hypothetical protein
MESYLISRIGKIVIFRGDFYDSLAKILHRIIGITQHETQQKNRLAGIHLKGKILRTIAIVNVTFSCKM